MYLVFDVETTGLPKNYGAPVEDLDNWPRAVQLAYAFYDDKKKAQSIWGAIIKPEGFVIPQEAARIHGINQARAVKTGIPLKEALKEIKPFLKDSKILIAHNIRFDIMVLGAEFLRSKIKTNLFGKGFEDAHDAKVDVLACASCFFELIKRGVITEG